MTGTLVGAFKGTVRAKGYYSFRAVIADDDFVSWTPEGGVGLVIAACSNEGFSGIWCYATGGCTQLAGSNAEGAATSLAGTTGTDGKVTLGEDSGTLYLENRGGAERTFIITVFCDDASQED